MHTCTYTIQTCLPDVQYRAHTYTFKYTHTYLHTYIHMYAVSSYTANLARYFIMYTCMHACTCICIYTADLTMQFKLQLLYMCVSKRILQTQFSSLVLMYCSMIPLSVCRVSRRHRENTVLTTAHYWSGPG